MLTWGAFNIVGASPKRRAEIEQARVRLTGLVDKEITDLDIEHDNQGNRAKAFMYCLETRCPETGWMIPISPSWIISRNQKVIAKLVPDHKTKKFDIHIYTVASSADLEEANKGTLQGGDIVYSLNGRVYRTSIKTIRGDYKDASGITSNKLRKWDKLDFQPAVDDIYQERLYCIQWFSKSSLEAGRPDTFF
jgi:hypothetical protein